MYIPMKVSRSFYENPSRSRNFGRFEKYGLILSLNTQVTCLIKKKLFFFHSVNIGTIPRFITGKKLDIWDKPVAEGTVFR